MDYDLVVTQQFGQRSVGERVSDRASVDEILAGHNAGYCVKVPAEEKAEDEGKDQEPKAALPPPEPDASKSASTKK